ncbi:HET-domain-containing protein [Hyaloscypha variabilis F]|uniref:HET-domain-containing protein n=1 Tax=Hyaloscypha variabilis (strain UAMH 11265 / GT02V1 / F) TaxID=1149755 RepID=A0A2J6S8S4_HYAVF|nr:HET-domain-containing protein [Hyaloscypha variabilis F]
MEPYIHRPLSYDNGFRILCLEPAVNFEAPLRCSLTEVCLSDKIQYEALSYVWGAPTGDRPLTCDGAELLITPNCELALRHLRLVVGSRSLWVDSVCINQKSTSDRNHQVQQMGEIYRKATHTLIWLGKSDEQTKSAFAGWRELEQRSKRSEILSLHERQYLVEICNKPWFRRVWTIQEVALATECLVLCGSESISWGALISATEHGHTYVEGRVKTVHARFRNLTTRMNSREFYNNRNLARSSTRIWMILAKCRREEATDARDKIFGLFAIITSLGLSIPAPDYSKTLAAVYEELTVRYIQEFHHLGLLELACTFGRDPEIPTWVPDFSDQKFFVSVDTKRSLPNMLVDSTLLIGRSPRKLPLRGKKIAQIDFRLHKSHFLWENLLKFRRLHELGSDQYHLLVPWVSVLREWMSLLDQVKCPTGKDATHLFSWLTTKDLHEAAADAGSYVPICRKVMEYMVESETKRIEKNEFNRAKGFERLQSSPDGVFWYLLSDILRGKVMAWVANCLDTVCEHTLFVLSTGHIGRGPYSIDDEDIVVWFAGAHRPMIIRPVGDNYILIGPAYIHGFKESDFWEEEEDVTKLEIFTLQ